jgi:hypothetical protein
MPRRPDSHVVGDIAVNRVVDVLNRCGWASQQINQDYGEDILVQTKVGDRIDPHRLWIQVKGTRSIDRFRRKNDDLVYEVSIEHVFKWIRSPDLVIFVLFDVERDRGYYALPVEQVDLWDLYGTQKKRFGIRISDDSVFDQKKAQEISWNARIEYFSAMFVVAEQKYAQVLQDRTLDSNYLPSFKNKGPLLIYEFLRTIGFLNDGKIDELFAAQFAACKRDLRTKDVEASDREIVGRAALLCFLGLVDRVTLGCGIPQPLLNAAVNIGLQLMNLYHSDTYLISPS